MKNKKYDHYLLRIIGLWGMGILFIAFTWLFLLYQVNYHQNSLVEVFSNNQYMETVKLSERIENKKEDIMDVKDNTSSSQNQSTFIYSKSEMFSLLDNWKYEGGQNIDEVKKLMNEGLSGVNKVTRNSEKGEEILSWSFFTIDKQEYVVTQTALVEYILTVTGTLEHSTKLYMLAALFTLGIICLCILFSLYIAQTTKKISSFEDEVKNKNKQIESFNTEVEVLKEVAEKRNTYDLATGVYNKDFFIHLMQTVNIQDLLPVTIIKISLMPLDNKDEDILDKDTLREVAQLFAEKIRTSGIVAYLGENEFSMVLFDYEESIEEFMCQIKDEVRLNITKDMNINMRITTKEEEIAKRTA
jgi:GGDEF domain-containing protein